jgi:N-ethylmaleimide reductase
MINSNFDQETGNKIIEDGDADLVAYGKPYQIRFGRAF